MKKSITIIIFFMMLSIFSSCAVQESRPSQTFSTSESVSNSSSFKMENATVSLLTKWNGECGGASSEEGYYYPVINEDGSFNISYIDYASQREILLCAIPNCTHSNESCTSWFPAGQGGLVPVVVGNQLLLISRGKELGTGVDGVPQISIMDLNGANRKTLTKFDSADELLPPFVGSESTFFCIQQTTAKNTEVQYSLLAVNLTTGQSVKMQSFDQQAVTIVGAFDKNILLKKTVLQGASAHYTLICYRTDMNILEEVATWSNFDRVLFVADDGYGFLEKNGTITYHNLETAAEGKTLENVRIPLDEEYGLEMVDLLDSYDDKVIFRLVSMGKEPGDRRDTHYGIALKEGTMCELSLQSSFGNYTKPLEIIDALKDNLLVVETIERRDKTMIGDDGVPYTAQIMSNQYALLSKDDYWRSVANYTSMKGLWF